MSQTILAYIEEQIAHHGNRLEALMLAKAIVLEALKSRPSEKKDHPLKGRVPHAAHDPAVLAKTAEQRARIMQLLEAKGPQHVGAIVVEMVGAQAGKVERDAIYNRVYGLLQNKQVRRLADGRYALPGLDKQSFADVMKVAS